MGNTEEKDVQVPEGITVTMPGRQLEVFDLYGRAQVFDHGTQTDQYIWRPVVDGARENPFLSAQLTLNELNLQPGDAVAIHCLPEVANAIKSRTIPANPLARNLWKQVNALRDAKVRVASAVKGYRELSDIADGVMAALS